MAKSMNAEIELPQEVIDWVGDIFRACNERVSEKLSNIPNAPETSLDLTFIEHLSRFASPITLTSSWTVRIDTHYLGGLRHFYRWEIADIGVLIYFRRKGRLLRRKVGLLQSKRLYPFNTDIREETKADYEIGFARIATSDEAAIPIGRPKRFEFGDTSKYGALKAKDEQYAAIQKYQAEKGIPVYYLLYNPWTLPFERVIPLTVHEDLRGECQLGCRVLPSKAIFSILDSRRKGTSLGIAALQEQEHGYGWRLENFMANLLLTCKEGHIFESHSEESIQSLFFRRTGPIAAAIAITIELPG